MNYIVLDLEFNQAFNFKNGTKAESNPQCPFEIIQIGAVKLDSSLNLCDSFCSYIKPQIYKRMHPFVEKITGITEAKLKSSSYFPEEYNNFLNFIEKDDSILCTWGTDDIKSLFKNILFYNLDYRLMTDKYINIQSIADEYLKCEQGKTIGLKAAVDALKIPLSTDFHNALNDAEYTAKIFKIVKPEVITYNTFDVLSLIKKKSSKHTNTKALLDYFKGFLKRELTQDEIFIAKSAYKLGHNNTYDLKKVIKKVKKSK